MDGCDGSRSSFKSAGGLNHPREVLFLGGRGICNGLPTSRTSMAPSGVAISRGDMLLYFCSKRARLTSKSGDIGVHVPESRASSVIGVRSQPCPRASGRGVYVECLFDSPTKALFAFYVIHIVTFHSPVKRFCGVKAAGNAQIGVERRMSTR